MSVADKCSHENVVTIPTGQRVCVMCARNLGTDTTTRLAFDAQAFIDSSCVQFTSRTRACAQVHDRAFKQIALYAGTASERATELFQLTGATVKRERYINAALFASIYVARSDTNDPINYMRLMRHMEVDMSDAELGVKLMATRAGVRAYLDPNDVVDYYCSESIGIQHVQCVRDVMRAMRAMRPEFHKARFHSLAAAAVSLVATYRLGYIIRTISMTLESTSPVPLQKGFISRAYCIMRVNF